VSGLVLTYFHIHVYSTSSAVTLYLFLIQSFIEPRVIEETATLFSVCLSVCLSQQISNDA